MLQVRRLQITIILPFFFQICMNQSCIDLLPLQSFARCPSDSQNRECSGRGVGTVVIHTYVHCTFLITCVTHLRYAPTSTPANVTTASWATTARRSRPPLHRRCIRGRLIQGRRGNRRRRSQRTRRQTSTYVSRSSLVHKSQSESRQ